MSQSPTRTLTFLFTDIEGSTARWEQQREAMSAALQRHDALLRSAIEAHGGQVLKTVGDAFYATFANASAALAAALTAQRGLAGEDWGAYGPDFADLHVRMGIHHGQAEARGDDYFGPALNRTARLMAVGHGGQVLLSLAAEQVVRDFLPEGVTLRKLGEFRLRDLSQPERVFQLVHPDLATDFPALRSLDAMPHNLPAQTTSFVGREAMVARVEELLGQARLVTLTGVGGAGKTRLALQVAANQLPRQADGVWLIELAPLREPGDVEQAIIGSLSIHIEARDHPLERIAEFIGRRRMLLLLDNCEHLLDACARAADYLLSRCPDLRLLASSREGLGIAGEVLLAVPSLSLPDPDRAGSPDELMAFESVQLFLERAAFARPGFTIDAGNAAAVASICRRLDGMPLAIELAAARTKLLSPAEIAGRLDACFRILTGGSRTALPRQQTLRATMDWSYDLLAAQERQLLGRLSVFQGGWDLAAAEAVGQGEEIEDWEVLDLLGALVDKSLVVVVGAESTRYRLLETVRAYAAERLEEAGETTAARDRHLTHYTALAETIQPHLAGRDQVAWFDRCHQEQANFVAAVEWAIETGDAASGFRIGSALAEFVANVGQTISRWHALIGRLDLDASLSPALYVRALGLVGAITLAGGDLAQARRYSEERLARARALGDPKQLDSAISRMAIIEIHSGNVEAASHLWQQNLAHAREVNDAEGLSSALLNLAFAATMRGDYAASRRLLEEALPIARSVSPGQVGYVVRNLANLAITQADGATAIPYLEEDASIQRRLGADRVLSETLRMLAMAYTLAGRHEEAQDSFGSSLEAARRSGRVDIFALTSYKLADLASADGRHTEAADRIQTALRGFISTGSPRHPSDLVRGLRKLALVYLDLARARDGALLWGMAEAAEQRFAHDMLDDDPVDLAAAEARLLEALGPAEGEAAITRGRGLALVEGLLTIIDGGG